MTSLNAAGPGDIKVGRGRKGRGQDPPKPRGGMQVGPPLSAHRYVEINGVTVWRPNAPGWPDTPGNINPQEAT